MSGALLDNLIGISQVTSDLGGDPIPARDTLHLIGSVVAEDDPANGETRVTFPSGDVAIPLTVTIGPLSSDVTTLDATGLDAADIVRLTTSAPIAISNMATPTADGDPRKTLVLVSGARIEIKHGSGFACPYGLSYYLAANSNIDVLYDSSSHVWRLIP